MAFGAFAPLPLRLGGTAETGWTAAQFSRFAADLLAARSARRFAVLTYTQGATPTVLMYRGVNGVGTAHAPTITNTGTGADTITFPAYYDDPRGEGMGVSITSGRVSIYGATVLVGLCLADGGRNAYVTVETPAGVATNATITIIFEGTLGEDRRIDDYGGFPDKLDCEEEETPYSWIWYMEYESMLGSAFTIDRTGLVHAKKLAKARLRGAGMQRAIERAANNSVPGTSSDLLPVWAKICNVQVGPGTPEYETRTDCAARMMLVAGSSRAQLDAAIELVLDRAFIATHRNDTNDLSDPPEPTIWPGGSDTGSATYSLCGYQYNSGRAHVWAEVVWPEGLSLSQFHHLTDVRLFRLMDVALPAHATFGWATSSGFILDESLLDYDAF